MAFKADSKASFNFIGVVQDEDIEEKDLTNDKHVNLLVYKEHEWET